MLSAVKRSNAWMLGFIQELIRKRRKRVARQKKKQDDRERFMQIANVCGSIR